MACVEMREAGRGALQWQKLGSWVTILMLTQKGQKQEGYHLGDSMEVAWRPPPGAPSMAVHGRLALAGAFPGHTPSLGIPRVCSRIVIYQRD